MVPGEIGSQEGILRLGVGQMDYFFKVGKLLLAAFPDTPDKLRVGVIGKELKRVTFPVFLSHEQHGNIRGEQDGGRRQLELFQVEVVGEPVA